jgi:membrane associated rhomboid family serine protease
MQVKLTPATSLLVFINVFVGVCLLWPGVTEIALPAGSIIPARFWGSDVDVTGTVSTLPFFVTPFTAPFIHSNMISMLLSGLMLLLMGSMSEKILGWQGIIVLFYGGALASAAVLVLFLPESFTPYSGAYDATSAVIAAYLLLYPVGKPMPWGPLTAEQARPLQLLLLWFILNLAMGFSLSYESLVSGVLAPVASFAAGLFMARPLLLWKYRHA